ncbi:hypothetical protein [Vreelandella nigrificans]|uniref:hypothetical protein n=1 Tax=Vreelandella nigrificans TaxID=2042704 RepID=UPI001AD81AB2|nr:hypothetical protein [Halomonas nigrificans]
MNAFNVFIRRMGRTLKRQSVLYAFCLSGLSSAAAATDIPEAYHLAADMHGVPPEILYAVALNESKVQLDHGVRPWPWTLNIAGKGYHFATRDEACDALFRALFETEIIDVGIAQLNVRWQPQLFGAGHRFVHHCDALEPYANLEEAARLLRQHYDDSGDWLVAAGRYHRPAGGAPAARYRRAIAANLAKLEAGSPSFQRSTGRLQVQFASVEEINASAASQYSSTPQSSFASVSEQYQPIAIDHSLNWVSPSEPEPAEPVSWIDPHVRWDRLVAAQ